MIGDERHVALFVRAPHGRRVKPAVNRKGVRILRLVEFAGVGRVAVYDLDVPDAARQGVDVLHEEPAFACAEAGDYGIAALDEREGLFKGDDFGSVVHEPFLH